MSGRRCLVVRGGWAGHAPVEATDSFLPFLREHGFTVVCSGSVEAYDDEELLSRCDLVVQCVTNGTITGRQLTNLRSAVERGTGLAGWHGGIVASFPERAYIQLVGGLFLEHPGDFVKHRIDTTVSNPIVSGLSDLELETEQYWVVSDQLNRVLASTTIPSGAVTPWATPITVPAVWTRNWGAGRVFVCSVGHGLAELAIPAVRSTIERGMLWAAGEGDGDR